MLQSTVERRPILAPRGGLWLAPYPTETDVRRRCGVRPEDKLVPNDIFIVKYAPGEQPGLNRHRYSPLL